MLISIKKLATLVYELKQENGFKSLYCAFVIVVQL